MTTRHPFTRQKESDHLFGEELAKGCFIEPPAADTQEPACCYRHPNGTLWLGDAIAWLKIQETGTADLVFADPPYNIRKDLMRNKGKLFA